MAWSWNHTTDGMNNAYRDLLHRAELATGGSTTDQEWLASCFCEWGQSEEWDSELYDRSYAALLASSPIWDHVADDIWMYACDAATCDNGGCALWVCPEGCHTVDPSYGVLEEIS